MNIAGFNHVTINVDSLERSLDFYCHKLKMVLKHRGNTDAYLEWGTAWICLVQRNGVLKIEGSNKRLGVDHVAFYISENDFEEAVSEIRRQNITIVRGPIKRGQGRSINFLDPDGTELELHTSNLKERLEVWT